MTRMDFKASANIAEIMAACTFGPEERSRFGAHAYKFLTRVYTRTPNLPASNRRDLEDALKGSQQTHSESCDCVFRNCVDAIMNGLPNRAAGLAM